MRVQSYINSAENIISIYDGKTPFSIWLKQFFAQHKKYGSKDRKHIAHLCYCTFRLGHALRQLDAATRIKCALFLCSEEPNNLLQQINEDWNNAVQLPIVEKIQLLSYGSFGDQILPAQEELSSEINNKAFVFSFLQQPLLYLRVRPGKEKKVEETLVSNTLLYKKVGEACIALQNSAKADAVLSVDEDVVVQDINSQKVLEPLKREISVTTDSKVWDCCAASGGKSILLMDTFEHVKLTVSDVRKNILQNLKSRFSRAGIYQYRSFIADAATVELKKEDTFDVIICDAPCSGSGTWSRTPEQLYFFEKEKIDHYSNLQKSIVKNTSRYVKKNGFFVYITCSVFKKENEDVVGYLEKETCLTLKSTTYFKGYNDKADTLFVALFKAS